MRLAASVRMICIDSEMPNAKPRVFLDTSVLRHAADRRIVAHRFLKRIRWGESDQEIELTRWMEHYPNQALHPGFRRRLESLPWIAHLAVRQRILLLCHKEVLWELLGLPRTQDTRGRFYGAPIAWVDPIRYGRVIADGRRDWDYYRLAFFEGITDARFIELQRATGTVHAGAKRLNQLADAFFIWCAERAGADYFLTTDLKLVRGIRNQRRHCPGVEVLAPDELVKRLVADRAVRVSDAVSYVWWAFKTRGQGPREHPLEALRETSHRLNRADGFE